MICVTKIMFKTSHIRVLHNLAYKRIHTDLYAQGALVRKKMIIFILYSNWPECGVNCLFLRRVCVA